MKLTPRSHKLLNKICVVSYISSAYVVEIPKKRLVMPRQVPVRPSLNDPPVDSVIDPLDFLLQKLREFYGAHILYFKACNLKLRTWKRFTFQAPCFIFKV